MPLDPMIPGIENVELNREGGLSGWWSGLFPSQQAGAIMTGVGLTGGLASGVAGLFSGGGDDAAKLKEYAEEYIKKFENRIGLSRDEQTMFARAEKNVLERQRQLEKAAMENLESRGMMRGGVGNKYVESHVTKPTADAFAALDYQRAQVEDARRQKLEQDAMAYAQAKLKEEKEKGGLFGDILGTITGIGAGLLTGNPMAVVGGVASGIDALGRVAGGSNVDAMLKYMNAQYAGGGNISMAGFLQEFNPELYGQLNLGTLWGED